MVGTDDPRVVAVERLDLDDLRALVGQQHGAERTRQHLREVDDADAVEGAEDFGHADRGPPGPLMIMMRAREEARGPARDHLSPQWLRRLISTVRSPSKTCLSSWFTP